MALPLVLLSHPLPLEWISSLQGRVRLLVGPTDPAGFAPDLLERVGEAEGILCLLSDKIDENFLNKAVKLRVISNMAVGIDNIDIQTCSRREIPVGNTPGVVTEATADLAMALLLAQARVLPKAAMDARDGLWRTWTPAGWLGADLRGATLGIVGMGKIGTAVAERARGFGLRIIYSSSKGQPDGESAAGAEYRSLKDLLTDSDFVSLHCPLTNQTRGMLDESAFKQMQKSAILINTARGPIVKMDALVRALREEWIRAAALDVTDPEPLPPNHPLFDLPNCLILPHIGSATFGTRRRMAEMACANLLAGIEGRVLPNQANPGFQI